VPEAAVCNVHVLLIVLSLEHRLGRVVEKVGEWEEFLDLFLPSLLKQRRQTFVTVAVFTFLHH
jgi:hypothetical protein